MEKLNDEENKLINEKSREIVEGVEEQSFRTAPLAVLLALWKIGTIVAYEDEDPPRFMKAYVATCQKLLESINDSQLEKTLSEFDRINAQSQV